MMTDPVADMLTRIRNAYRIDRRTVNVPKSRLKSRILEVLKKEGYVADIKEFGEGAGATLRVYLKYGPDGERVINEMRRRSKPGSRLYKKVKEIEPVLNGLGVGVYSTPRGILTDRECHRHRVGGEYLFSIW